MFLHAGTEHLPYLDTPDREASPSDCIIDLMSGFAYFGFRYAKNAL